MRVKTSGLLVACLLYLSAVSAQNPPSIAVRGLGGRSVTVTEADLARLPQQTITTLDHGTPVIFQGVRLSDVLAKVDLPLGDKFHSTAASYYVIAEGRDGYRALFAWAEVDSGFMDKEIYVATKRDNKPLPGNAGPFQLVVPGERRGGRWLRQLTAVSVGQAN
jgi:hypothetical protein